MPVWKAALALSLAPMLASTTLPHTPPAVANYPQVKKIECATGSGSGVLTERGWVSAAHVTNIGECSIDGLPISSVPEKGLDFSTVQVAIQGHGLRIDCGGFKTGTYVWAIGFAGGFEWQTMTRHYVTFAKNRDGLRILLGSPTVIPGMSGGAILNEQGAVVGVVNAYNAWLGASYSRELKDTSACQPTGSGHAQVSLPSGPPATRVRSGL